MDVMMSNLNRVHDIARDNLKASQERQKGIYDLKYNQNVYNVGDVVYKLNQATKVGQSAKLKSPWKGPYLITAWRSPVLYKIKDRKTESWIHHDRIKLCEDRELPIWIKRMRNQLMDQTMDEETNEIYECPIGLPDIFKENTNVMSSSDPLMSHFIGDAAIVGAPDPLVSHTVSNSTSSENKALTDIMHEDDEFEPDYGPFEDELPKNDAMYIRASTKRYNKRFISPRGNSPLHMAVIYKKENIVTTLITLGADPSARNNELPGHQQTNLKIRRILRTNSDLQIEGTEAAAIIKHWVDSILTYTADTDEIMPMILFATTHRDMCEEIQKMKESFLADIKEMFSSHEKKNHIHLETLYFINGVDKNDVEIKK
ncbi:unnamed protein product [Mytilus edulis]|uniref:Uncharacterized protein n=1 Tax=Mytilus edulis TaxID=6550 RepID=A0A8S3SMW9_MYTED|nr:unnamed protein product [Mytilus edulis]